MKDFETKRFKIRKSIAKDAKIFEKILFSKDKFILKNSVEMINFTDDMVKALCFLSASNEYCYTVIKKDTKEIVGSVSLRPEENEIGGWVAPEHQGKGYSREIFKAFMDNLLKERPYVIAQHYSNEVCNMFARCGMRKIGEVDSNDFVVNVYEKTPEATKSNGRI